jgi:iron complex transport system ATP-binding protein
VRAGGFMIKVENLTAEISSSFKLQDICFELHKGEILGILGPNGAGKSSLLKLVAGYIREYKGTINLLERSLREYNTVQKARLLAVVPQEPLPVLGFKVREIIQMGRYVHQNILGWDRENAEKCIQEALEIMGLQQLEQRRLHTLSGGERQRTALAKALAQDTRILLLDEPTTHLDPAHQIHFMVKVRQSRKQKELSVLTVMHDLNLAARYCDRLLLLDKGKIAAYGGVEEVITVENLKKSFGLNASIVRHPVDGVIQLLF